MATNFWDEPEYGKEMTASELISFAEEIRGNVPDEAKVRVKISFKGGIQRIEVDPSKVVEPIIGPRPTRP